MKLQNAKGVRDISPEEMILRQNITGKLKKVFEKYGYNPLETPIVERYDVLSVKYGAGDESEAAKEIFQFKDQGKRNLGLRFELTLSMCRYIAMNPNTKMPFKRYEIGRVYRDGPIKLGRTREFYQCDVDIVGTNEVIADAEIIKLVIDVFKELGLDAYIEVNNRKLLNGILEYADVKKEKRMPTIIILDKLKKIGVKGVNEELKQLGVKESSLKKINKIFKAKENLTQLRKLIKNNEGVDELEELFSYFSKKELENVIFNISLARGLSYYTGIVFEGFLRKSEVTSSICGGGRYDDLIGLLLQSKEKIPATGISFGLVPIMEAMKLTKIKTKKTVTNVFVIPIGNTKNKALQITQDLRKANINVDIDLIGRGISKNLNYANIMKIPYVIFVGEKELKQKKVKLRDMKSGKEKMLAVQQVSKYIK